MSLDENIECFVYALITPRRLRNGAHRNVYPPHIRAMANLVREYSPGMIYGWETEVLGRRNRKLRLRKLAVCPVQTNQLFATDFKQAFLLSDVKIGSPRSMRPYKHVKATWNALASMSNRLAVDDECNVYYIEVCGLEKEMVRMIKTSSSWKCIDQTDMYAEQESLEDKFKFAKVRRLFNFDNGVMLRCFTVTSKRDIYFTMGREIFVKGRDQIGATRVTWLDDLILIPGGVVDMAICEKSNVLTFICDFDRSLKLMQLKLDGTGRNFTGPPVTLMETEFCINSVRWVPGTSTTLCLLQNEVLVLGDREILHRYQLPDGSKWSDVVGLPKMDVYVAVDGTNKLHIFELL